jgi:hypothetical protein
MASVNGYIIFEDGHVVARCDTLAEAKSYVKDDIENRHDETVFEICKIGKCVAKAVLVVPPRPKRNVQWS